MATFRAGSLHWTTSRGGALQRTGDPVHCEDGPEECFAENYVHKCICEIAGRCGNTEAALSGPLGRSGGEGQEVTDGTRGAEGEGQKGEAHQPAAPPRGHGAQGGGAVGDGGPGIPRGRRADGRGREWHVFGPSEGLRWLETDWKGVVEINGKLNLIVRWCDSSVFKRAKKEDLYSFNFGLSK